MYTVITRRNKELTRDIAHIQNNCYPKWDNKNKEVMLINCGNGQIEAVYSTYGIISVVVRDIS